MSSLTYTNYPGTGQLLSDTTHYSQAVRLPTTPPTIKISGQGGWDPTTGAMISPDASQQIERAFANVDLMLRHAGAKGWSEVYLARMFYVLDGERDGEEWKKGLEVVLEAGGEALRKWCPGHRPALTAVEVRGLALEGMRVEVEAEALVGA